MFVLISGNSSSGKSEYAENLLSGFRGKKIYIAASKIYADDDEMKLRIARHKERRKDKGFITIECSENLSRVEIPEGSCVLIESLTAWTANEMFLDSGEIRNSEYVCGKIYRDFMSIKERAKNIILVTDDIFCDCVTYDDSTEEYIKSLACLCKKFADVADKVEEIFFGISFLFLHS